MKEMNNKMLNSFYEKMRKKILKNKTKFNLKYIMTNF
jgi:hypothetical protein